MRRASAGSGLVVLAALVALAGCGAPGDAGAEDGGEPTSGSSLVAPVLDRDFPDPDVLEVDGTYYAFATNNATSNVQVATSSDLQTWEYVREDPLPELPSWIIPGKTWAPEVTEVEPGRFVMYLTATNFQPSRQCIAVAVADAPLGPYVVQGEGMLVCPDEEGGAIDASTFRDAEGTWHLAWKNDGNCCGLDTWLQTAPLTPDGLSLAGAPVRLLMQTESWEGDLVEAPTIIERDGRWYLFYSANSYGGPEYAIGLATADDPAGPWTKQDGPWFSTEAAESRYLGPGGQDLVVGPDGEDLLVFHAWNGSFTERDLHVIRVEWEDGVPVPVLEP